MYAMNSTAGEGNRNPAVPGQPQGPHQHIDYRSGGGGTGGGGGQYNSHQLSMNHRHHRDWEQGHEHGSGNRGGRRGWRPTSTQGNSGSGGGMGRGGSGNTNEPSDHYETGSDYKRRHHIPGANRHHYGSGGYHHNHSHMHSANQYAMPPKNDDRGKGNVGTPSGNSASKFFLPKSASNENTGKLSFGSSLARRNVRDETEISNPGDTTGDTNPGFNTGGTAHRHTATTTHTQQQFHPASLNPPGVGVMDTVPTSSFNSNRVYDNQSAASSAAPPNSMPTANSHYFQPHNNGAGTQAVPQPMGNPAQIRLSNLQTGRPGVTNLQNPALDGTAAPVYMMPQQLWGSQYHTIGDPMGRGSMVAANVPNWMPMMTTVRQVYPYSSAAHNGDVNTTSQGVPAVENSNIATSSAPNTDGFGMQLLDMQPFLIMNQRRAALLQINSFTTPPQFDESKQGEDPASITVIGGRIINTNLRKLLDALPGPLVLPRHSVLSSVCTSTHSADRLGDENACEHANRVNTTVTTPVNEGQTNKEGTGTCPPAPGSSKKRIYPMELMYTLKKSPAANAENIPLREALQEAGLVPSTPLQFQPGRTYGNGGHARRRSLGSQTVHTPSPVIKGISPKQLDGELSWTRNRSDSSRRGMAAGTGMRQTPVNLSRVDVIRRKVKNLLNKMTVERFVAIADGIAEILEGTEKEDELKVIVDEVYMKAVSEPDFSEMYTDLVLVLRARSPQFLRPAPSTAKPANFQRGIVARCQEEFEHIKSFSTMDLPEELLNTLSEEDIENERKQRKKRTLGNMRFIGELFMRRVLSGLALKQILYSLVEVDDSSKSGIEATPEPHLIECICEVLTTIGYNLEVTSPETLATLCATLDAYKCMGVLEKRIQYKIQDVLDLRANQWRQKLVHRTKAKALNDIRCELSSDIEVVGLESDYPYKPYVNKWNTEWYQKRKEERANNLQKGKQGAAAALNTPPAAQAATDLAKNRTFQETPNQATEPNAMLPATTCSSSDLQSKLLKSCRQALSAADKEIFLSTIQKPESSKEQEQLEAILRVLGEDESDPQGIYIPAWISEAVGLHVSDQSMIHFERAATSVLERMKDFACDKPTAPLCFARCFIALMEDSKFAVPINNIIKKNGDVPGLQSFWGLLKREVLDKFGGADQAQKRLNEQGICMKLM